MVEGSGDQPIREEPIVRGVAAVFQELDTPLVVDEVEIDEPRAGEVLVRVVAAGVCHTDALAVHGDLPFPAPGVLGHEGAGVVEAVGEGVTSVAPGTKVVIGWPWCGACRNCLDGEPRYCLQIGPLVTRGGRADGSTALRRGGAVLHSHFFGQSSFATHAIADANALVAVPDDVPVELLGPLACGIGTGAGAVLNALQPPLGSSLVVYGSGAVGLAAVMAAACTGATRIVAVDVHEHRLRLATELGATDSVDASASNPVEAVAEICGGPADFALECTGDVDVLRQAADSVGMRGTVALIGGAPADAEFTLDHVTTLWGKRVVGILGGERRSETLIRSLIDLNRQGRFPYERLITEFPLEQVNEAFAASHSGDVIKPLLRMPGA
jgi:aryl-alcohol dehydrogenase